MARMKPQRNFHNEMQVTEYPEVNAVIGVGHGMNERTGKETWVAKAYSGRRNRPDFHYLYYSQEAVDRQITHYLESLRLEAEAKAERKAARQAKHDFKVGDILHYSWGYDQTNCEFYQVVEVRGQAVDIRPIAGRTVENSDGFMSCRLTPVPNHFIGPVIKKRGQARNYDNKLQSHIAMEFGSATKCDADAEFYSSWYA